MSLDELRSCESIGIGSQDDKLELNDACECLHRAAFAAHGGFLFSPGRAELRSATVQPCFVSNPIFKGCSSFRPLICSRRFVDAADTLANQTGNHVT